MTITSQIELAVSSNRLRQIEREIIDTPYPKRWQGKDLQPLFSVGRDIEPFTQETIFTFSDWANPSFYLPAYMTIILSLSLLSLSQIFLQTSLMVLLREAIDSLNQKSVRKCLHRIFNINSKWFAILHQSQMLFLFQFQTVP